MMKNNEKNISNNITNISQNNNIEKQKEKTINDRRKKKNKGGKMKFKRVLMNFKLRTGIMIILCIIIFISAYSSAVAFQQPTTKEETITTCNYNQRGIFDYTVYLKGNTFYDDTRILKPGEGIIFKKITDYINGSFNYQFTCNKTGTINVSYKVDAELKTNIWNKEYNLIPIESFEVFGYSSKFSINFPIDYSYYEVIIDKISEEIGVYAGDQNLIIKCIVLTEVRLKNATIYESFSPSISVKLGDNIIEITGELSQSNSDALFGTREVFQPELVEYRQNSLITSIVFLFILIAFFGLTKSKVKTISKAEKIMLRLRKKYGEWLVEVDNPPSIDSIQNVIPLKSTDDIIKISEELGKPILYYQDSLYHGNIYTLYVLDEVFQYKFILNPN
jgi:hypothetical protein